MEYELPDLKLGTILDSSLFIAASSSTSGSSRSMRMMIAA